MPSSIFFDCFYGNDGNKVMKQKSNEIEERKKYDPVLATSIESIYSSVIPAIVGDRMC
ncbi:hypothetical protein GCM10007162_14030 [Ignatzschineria ureiclastica]|nr:hypothetical protein GCM10007162_14030 [Ignatzschineria ureiclastica]